MNDDKLDGLLDSFNTSAGLLDEELEVISKNKRNKNKKKSNYDFQEPSKEQDVAKSRLTNNTGINNKAGISWDTYNAQYKANTEAEGIELDYSKMSRKEKKEHFRIMEAHEFDIEDLLGYPGDFRKEKLDKKFRKKFKIYRCKKPKKVFKNPSEFADFFLEYHNQDKLAAILLNDKSFYAFLRAHSDDDVAYRLQYKKFIQLVSTIFKEVDFSGEL